MDIIVESDDEEEGKKDGHGIYSGAEGPSAQGPINGLLTVCQGKQSLITPAVVFMLPTASALHHLFGFALQLPIYDFPLLLLLLLHHHTWPPSVPPPPFFLITFTLFSL